MKVYVLIEVYAGIEYPRPIGAFSTEKKADEAAELYYKYAPDTMWLNQNEVELDNMTQIQYAVEDFKEWDVESGDYRNG